MPRVFLEIFARFECTYTKGAAGIGNKIYIVGGYGKACRSLECVDLSNNRSFLLKDFETGRWGLGVIACNGR